MRCSVNFRGSWAPTLEWRLHDGNREADEQPRDVTDWANIVIVPNANISSSLIVTPNSTSNLSYYSCKMYFKLESSGQVVSANNTPDYSFQWKSPLIISLPKKVISPTHWKIITTNDAKNVNGKCVQ